MQVDDALGARLFRDVAHGIDEVAQERVVAARRLPCRARIGLACARAGWLGGWLRGLVGGGHRFILGLRRRRGLAGGGRCVAVLDS